MIKKILLTLLLLASTGISQDERWKILTFSDEYLYFYDSLTANRNGQIIKAWIKLIPWDKDSVIKEKKNKASFLDSDKYDQFSYTLMFFAFNCSLKAYKLIRYLDYNEDGKAIKSYNYNEKEIEWEDVIPNTLGEELLIKLCQKIKK